MRGGCARCRGSCSRRSGRSARRRRPTWPPCSRHRGQRWRERRSKLPRPEFQPDLPVNERRADIAELIAKNQVVIVCGETGSGKTTQLPKICLDLGLGARGLIGHTQPRRLAARSVATRLAQELKTQVGAGVGVKIRFHDKSTADSWVKLMTDGILLAESQSDPWLNAYEAIIIDEAHERSLNIDFLLGYLKQLLPRRPDLKLIITSATIDAERFAQHFDGAPVIEVSGRLYPVEVRYRPVADLEKKDDERDLYDAIVDAADELARLGSGDILVFLPGEREIREAAEALRKHALARPGLSSAHAPEILPLFSRLSACEQDRIFKPSRGQRRIVLATNVAETSLTVPGIRYVIDTGLARVKRYSYRNKVEQLQVEGISQAAARQRAGRCGRVAAGVCVRLYDEADFNARPPFTDPEILRSSLAGVILRMKSLKLTDVESFPFIEPPPAKAISDGYALLQELGALDDDNRLTKVGDALGKLPLDPRIGRMLVAARDLGCLKEVLVIAAALSVQDPRERPQERQQAADEKHRQFADEKSEFLAWVKLWAWFRNAVEHKKSNRQLVDAVHANFLSYLRLREWREVHSQLHAMVTELGWKENDIPGTFDAIHQALLSGLLGNIGCKSDESGYYLGARGIRYLIHPSSPLQKKAGKWIMAAEITETTRLFGRCIARIEADWIEKVGAHLIKRQFFDPHWEKRSMQVSAWERTTLYGVVIDPKRRIHYGPLAPAEAREIFIRQGLVGEEIEESFARRWPFFQHNQKQIRDIEKIEHKQRRQDVLVDDELIFAFYDHLIPEGIHNGAAFDHWRRQAEQENPRLLFLAKDDLMRHSAAGVTTEAFPHHIKVGGVDYPLAYHFEPGSPRDGVTLTLPLAQLNQIPAARMEWLVPGLLKEKLVQLIKTLPQRIRAKLVPVPEFVEEFVSTAAGDERRMNQGLIPPLIDYILEARGLNARGWAVTADAFRPDALPAALLDELQADRRARPPARHEPQPRPVARRMGQAGQGRVRRTARDAIGIHATDRLDLRRTARADGSAGRRADSARLPGAGGRRRERQPESLRLRRRGGGIASRRLAAPVHAAIPRAGEVFRQEHPRPEPDGHAIHGAGQQRRPEAPDRRPDLRARLPERAAADDAGGLRRALRRGQGAARADHAGGLPAGRHRAERVAGGDEEAAGIQGACRGGGRHRGATEAPGRQALRRRHAVRAPAALPALPEGGRRPPRQTEGEPGARRATDGRVRAAVEQLRAPRLAIGQNGRI